MRIRDTDKITCLCDLCRTSLSYMYLLYKNKRVENKEIWCDPCSLKRSQSTKKGFCIDCGASFMSSAYWFFMKKTDFPVRCSGCRLA